MTLGLTKKRAAFLLCSVAMVVMADAAIAKPVHKHRAARTAAPIATSSAVVDDRYANVTAQPSQAVEPARAHSRRQPRRTQAAQAQADIAPSTLGFGSTALVSEARKYLGTNPTGRGSLWCGAFMDMVLKRTGHAGGGNLASAYARYGSRISGPQVGAIAVMGRKGGGHVGVVAGIDADGNPIIISGNHNNTVAESVYPRGRIYAYVMPNG